MFIKKILHMKKNLFNANDYVIIENNKINFKVDNIMCA